jgi:iron complex outermembrane recepter protein
MQKTNMRLRSALLVGAATAAAIGLTAGSFAASDDIETVVVTGSRIPHPNVDSPTAIVSISADILQSKGVISLGDTLRDLPSAGISGYTSTNTAFSTAGAGISTVELRNLGEDRTLVLVNGRRHVAGVSGSNAVDFNAIPTDLIDRVEVITGGASAIYGSDALAGVVNVITKQNFEGITANFQTGRTDHNDEVTYKVSATMGGNFAKDKGNAVISIAWSRNEGVKSKDRSDTKTDNIAACYVTGDTADCGKIYAPYYSSYSAYGRFTILSTGKNYTVSSGTGATGTVSSWSSSLYGFNRQEYRTIETPVDRLLFSGNGHYNFTDNLQMYVETTYAHTSSSTSIEPFGTSNDDINIDGISIDNPYMPETIRAAAIAAGDTYVGYARRLLELGPRQYEVNRDTYRLVTGFKGSIFTDYNWDVYFDWGHTADTQYGTGYINAANLREALNATTDSSGNIVCADSWAVAEGCVPINLFGSGSITKAAADYISGPQSRITNIDQKVLAGQLEGSIYSLPAGDIKGVVGFEWRVESSKDIPDVLTQSGQNASNKEPPTEGSFRVWEIFTETDVPILKDVPFAKELTVGGAWRWSQYNTQGITNAYTGRASWAPFDDLRFRGQYARAVRAPNINELFAPGGDDYSSVSDPCNGVTATSTGTVAMNCLADPYIAARVASAGSFTLTQEEIQGTAGTNYKGNKILTPEKSNSWSIGTVFNHDFADAGIFTLSIDYFNIDVKNVIDLVGRQDALDLCYSGTYGNSFCDMVVRQSSGAAYQLGAITEVNTGYANLGYLKTSGVDYSISHAFDLNNVSFLDNGKTVGLSDAGQMATRINWT